MNEEEKSPSLKNSETTECPKLSKSRKEIKQKLQEYFKAFTGHDAACISSFNNFVEFMHSPTDGASLGVGRMLFGLMMLIDIPDERGGGDLDLNWGETKDCRFPLFNFLEPFSLPRMGILYGIMWLGALGITLGYKFRMACLMFLIPYWYIFLLDKSAWNNHSYLYGLLGLIFTFTNANRFFSIDALKNPKMTSEVPFWNYFILKYQFFLLYFLAGAKKFCSEWLSGYAMTNLSYHWVFTPFRFILGPEMTDLFIVHWFGCIFDLSIAFWMIYEPTRPWATPFACAFHLMNSRLFRIGMFPWVCLVELPLFYHVDWPRTILRRISKSKTKLTNAKPTSNDRSPEKEINSKDFCSNCRKLRAEKRLQSRQQVVVVAIIAYMSLQLFLPYSHFITQGYNGWTNGLYGYSWDMMVHAWDTVLVAVKVVDNNNGKQHFLEPYAFTDSDRWTKHADMAFQYAHCINQRLQDDFRAGKNRALTSDDLSIYFDVWTSMNGRFQQRFYNSTVDLLKAEWSPFQRTPWILPLLKEFTNLRPKMAALTKEVLAWSNYTDLVFVADFPGLGMDHYISPHLDNVTLRVLEGSIRYEGERSAAISKEQSLSVMPGDFHKVFVIGEQPASYMYTYVNKTMMKLKEDVPNPEKLQADRPILPLWTEFMNRLEDYRKFFVHVGNSLLFEIYGVPMPRRLRELRTN